MHPMTTRKRRGRPPSNVAPVPPKRICASSSSGHRNQNPGNNNNIEEPVRLLVPDLGASVSVESVSMAGGSNNIPVSGSASAANRAVFQSEPGQQESAPPKQEPQETAPPEQGLSVSAQAEQEPTDSAMMTRKRRRHRPSNVPKRIYACSSSGNRNQDLGNHSGSPELVASVSMAEGSHNGPVSGPASAANRAVFQSEPELPEHEPTEPGQESVQPEQPEAVQPLFQPELHRAQSVNSRSNPAGEVIPILNSVRFECLSTEAHPFLIVETGYDLTMYRPVARLGPDNRLVRVEDQLTGPRQPTLGDLASEFWRTLKNNFINYIQKDP